MLSPLSSAAHQERRGHGDSYPLMRLYLATEQAKHTTAAGRRVGLLHGWACTSALTGCMERVGGWGAACLAYGSYLSSYWFGSGQALRGTPNPNRCLGWCGVSPVNHDSYGSRPAWSVFWAGEQRASPMGLTYRHTGLGQGRHCAVRLTQTDV